MYFLSVVNSFVRNKVYLLTYLLTYSLTHLLTYLLTYLLAYLLQLVFLHPGISANQAHALNRFLETTFILSTTASPTKGLALVYEI